jgi:glycosyltransferase involved in cell wall biosynthesis
MPPFNPHKPSKTPKGGSHGHPHHEPPKPKILFVLRRRSVPFYDVQSGEYNTSSGLINSAGFVNDMLQAEGFDSKLVQVDDFNRIDREVTLYRPTHCVIEALWVVPTKFAELVRLHPTVTWIVRVHSEIPFLAQEGMALTWIFGYLKQPNVEVSFNSARTAEHFQALVSVEEATRITYLPNYYPVRTCHRREHDADKLVLDVGCFGAIRPLKNQLTQAVAAVTYAKKERLQLRYHINGDRKEGNGENTLKNVRALFANLSSQFRLVEHPWYEHDDFIKVVKTMDLGLQVSFSETYNIVTADFVSSRVPVVVSKEIEWVSKRFQADCTDVNDIVNKIAAALWWKKNISLLDINLIGLTRDSEESKNLWKQYLTK